MSITSTDIMHNTSINVKSTSIHARSRSDACAEILSVPQMTAR